MDPVTQTPLANEMKIDAHAGEIVLLSRGFAVDNLKNLNVALVSRSLRSHIFGRDIKLAFEGAPAESLDSSENLGRQFVLSAARSEYGQHPSGFMVGYDPQTDRGFIVVDLTSKSPTEQNRMTRLTNEQLGAIAQFEELCRASKKGDLQGQLSRPEFVPSESQQIISGLGQFRTRAIMSPDL